MITARVGATDAARASGYVRLLEVDAALVRGVPAAYVDRLRRQLVVDTTVLAAGEELGRAYADESVFALLVLDGLLVRSVTVAGRRTAELLGPEDIVRPWQEDGRDAVLPSASRWTAHETTRVARLDSDFLALTHRFPGVVEEIVRRLTDRSHRLAERLAIATIPSLSVRVLALLWHIADRWGVVVADGVLVPLPLSHQVLADLACAQRPSVSVAVKHLVFDKQVLRRSGRGWLLLGPMDRS